MEKKEYNRLAKIFYYAGFIESWGHGTIIIVENCIKQGLPEPDFVEEYEVMTVTVYKDKWTGENLKNLGLNKRQIKAVLFVKERGKITNKNIRGLFKVSRETATRDLIFLLEKDILLSFGSKRAGALQSV